MQTKKIVFINMMDDPKNKKRKQNNLHSLDEEHLHTIIRLMYHDLKTIAEVDCKFEIV